MKKSTHLQRYFTILLLFFCFSGAAFAQQLPTVTVNATTNGIGGPPPGATFNISSTDDEGAGFSMVNVAYGTLINLSDYVNYTVIPNPVAGFITPAPVTFLGGATSSVTVNYAAINGNNVTIFVAAKTDGLDGAPAGATYDIRDAAGRGAFELTGQSYGVPVIVPTNVGDLIIIPNAVSGFVTPSSVNFNPSSTQIITVEYISESGGGTTVNIAIGLLFKLNGGEVNTTATPTARVMGPGSYDSGNIPGGTVLTLEKNTTYQITFSYEPNAAEPPETEFTTGTINQAERFYYDIYTVTVPFQVTTADASGLPAGVGVQLAGVASLGFLHTAIGNGASGSVQVPVGTYTVSLKLVTGWYWILTSPTPATPNPFSPGTLVISSPSDTPATVTGEYTRTIVTYGAAVDPASLGSGSVSPTIAFPPGTAPYESTVTITVTPNAGSSFGGYRAINGSGDPLTLQNVVMTPTSLSFTLLETTIVYIRFDPNDVINFTAGANGLVDGVTFIQKTTAATTTAQPNTDYHFVEWHNDDSSSTYSTNNPLITSAPSGVLNLTAIFERDNGTLQVLYNSAASGASYDIQAGFDGGPSYNGLIVSFDQAVPTGDYTVTFQAVADYDVAITTSASGGTAFTQSMTSTGTIGSGETHVINAIYTRHTGTLNVVLNDGGSGATFDVIPGSPDGLNLTNQNASISQAAGVGSYQIAFDAVPGYTLAITTGSSAGTPFTTANPSTGTIAQGETHTVTATYTRQVGTLAVVLNDGGSGATYDVTSSAADGLTLTGQSTNTSNPAPAADYTVAFDAVPGFVLVVTTSSSAGTPFSTANPSTGTVGDGETHTVTATYTRAVGTLAVVLNDGGSGATYDVTSSAADGLMLTGQSTSTSNPAPAANYTVTFDALPGYVLVVATSSSAGTPFSATNPSTGTIADGETHTVTATYTRKTGSLTVNILPAGAVANGAGWRLLYQNDFRPSGDTQNGIPADDYIVELAPASGYITPANFEVDIYENTETVVTVIYSDTEGETGSITVIFQSELADLGAQWRILSSSNGNIGPVPADLSDTWFDSGETVTGLTVGEYTIEFSTVPGYIIAAPEKVTIKAGVALKLEPEYVRPFIAHTTDYDGDGIADLPVYDPETRRYLVQQGFAGKASPPAELLVDRRFGSANDVMTPGDYDGDGKTDLAYYRPKSGEWKVQGQFKLKNFGQANDIPVPGDYNGDGLTDAALYRAETGEWMIYYAPSGKIVTVDLGGPTQTPVPANWNGDEAGTTEPAVYDVATGAWTVSFFEEKTGEWKISREIAIKLGKPGDIPVPGDYDGDGSADAAVFRPSERLWLTGGILDDLKFGKKGDFPVANVWAGEDRAVPAIFRPRKGLWQSYDKQLKARHGANGQPLVSGKR